MVLLPNRSNGLSPNRCCQDVGREEEGDEVEDGVEEDVRDALANRRMLACLSRSRFNLFHFHVVCLSACIGAESILLALMIGESLTSR